MIKLATVELVAEPGRICAHWKIASAFHDYGVSQSVGREVAAFVAVPGRPDLAVKGMVDLGTPEAAEILAETMELALSRVVAQVRTAWGQSRQDELPF